MGLFQAHAGFDPVGAGFVGTGNNAGALPAIGDGYRTSAPFGMIALFDRGKEGIHVYQCNGAGPDYGTVNEGFGMICMMFILEG